MPLSVKDTIQGTITNAQNATTADTAGKLSANAGSTTQPVYFSGGKPVVTGYTLAKSVPADAKFTDTNTDTKNTAGSTNTTSKLFLVGATTQGANPQTYSNAEVYENGGAFHANGLGADKYLAYPGGGFCEYGGDVTGYCKITLPTLWNSTMMIFSVSIFNYSTGTTTEYMIAGYNYSGQGWYNCTAVCIGQAGGDHSNLTVRFGDNGSKNVITIGEATTKWSYPRIAVHDVVLGNSDFETYKNGWKVEITNTGASNISGTVANTHVGYGSTTTWDKVTGKPSTFTPSSHTHTKSQISDFPSSLPANGGNSSTVNGHSVNSDVPSGAKFTDTNTWRGIQNNLTSDSTTDSLSAAQGKALKGLVDGKAASGHTHDDRYYTESEMNTKLNGKSNTGHTHSAADITSGVLTVARGGTGATTALDAYRGLFERGSVAADTDWNTLTAGVWVVAQEKWTANKNQPESAYGYGNVVVTNNGSNISQIYIAHTRGQLWFRERFGSGSAFAPWACVSVNGHTHSNVLDINDGGATTFAYSKSGLGYNDYTCLAAWNGKELRAVGKSQFAQASHTHPYAGATSSGGSATSAAKLDTATAGSATQPVYFTGGKPTACSYTLGKSVPSNAVFTDTTYSDATTSTHGLMTAADKTKLNGISAGANRTIIDSAISQSSGNPVANAAITKRLQFLYSFKISRDAWNEASDKSNWNVIVPWSNSSGVTLSSSSSSGMPNLTTDMSLGPAMMERTSSLSDNIILAGELSMINQGQIYVCDTNKVSFVVKRRPVCDLMLYFYARQWTT